MRLASAIVSAVMLSMCLTGLGCVTSDPDHHGPDEHYAHAGPPVQEEHHDGRDDHQQNNPQQNDHQQNDHQQNDHQQNQ